MSTQDQIIYEPPLALMKSAHVSGMAANAALVAEAEADHEAFWARQARELLTWKKPFTKEIGRAHV